MPDSLPTYFHTNLPLLVFLFACITSFGYAWFTYRRSVPPIKPGYRLILGILRGSGTLLALLLLFAPELILEWQLESKPQIAIAVDNSASMSIGDRTTKARQIYNDILPELRAKSELVSYFFNSDTSRLHGDHWDSVRYATDMDNAIRSLTSKYKQMDALILITDGNVTAGDNPMFTKAGGGTRIYTVGIGDTIAPPDILISQINRNRYVYRDMPFEINVDVSARGLSGKQTNLIVRDGNRTVVARRIAVPDDGATISVPVTLTIGDLGLKNFSVELESLAGEAIAENNRRSFTVHVLKSVLKVSILADQPGYDTKFLTRVFDEMPDVRTAVSIDRPGQGNYLQSVRSVLDSVDVLLLIDYPGRNSKPADVQLVKQAIESKRVPLIYLISKKPERSSIEIVMDRFGISGLRERLSGFQTLVEMTPYGQKGSWFKIYDTAELNERFWDELPPIDYPLQGITSPGNATIILRTATKSGSLPVMLSARMQNSKNILLIGSGFWRWQFLMAENNEFLDGWQRILNNALRWLSLPTDNDNVVITTGSDEYQAGETVVLETQVYDGQFNPVSDGLVRLRVKHEQGDFELTAEHTGEGRYASRFSALAPGNYTVEAEAWRNDVNIGTANKQLYVSELNNEFLNTAQDTRLLRQLAARSGGIYVSDSNPDKLLAALDLQPPSEKLQSRIELWNKLAVLLLIIGLFSIEWFFGKRFGLA